MTPAERMAQTVNPVEWIEQHGFDLALDQMVNLGVGLWLRHRRRPVIIDGHGTLTAQGTLTAHGVVVPAAA